METGCEVAKMVMESRGGVVARNVIQEAEQIISKQQPLSIQTFIAHERCQHSINSHCANAELVEVWTITLKRNCRKDEKTLEVLFLKNAVRSHLHFSQLNSWITNNGGKLPNETTCAYRLSSSNETMAFGGENDERCETHSFPVARCNSNSYLFVNVKWCKRDAPPQLKSCIPFNDFRYESEEWLLPSGSMCSSLSSHSFSSPGGSCNGTPHFFISPDDDRFEVGTNTETRSMHNVDKIIFTNDEDSGDEMKCTHKAFALTHSNSHQSSTLTHSSSSHNTDDNHETNNNNSPTEASFERCSSSEHSPRDENRKAVRRIPFECDDDVLIDVFTHALPTAKKDGAGVVMNCERVLIGSTEVESLSDFLATSSSVSPLGTTASCVALGSRRESLPRRSQIAAAFRSMSSAPAVFSKTTGLPLNSSPAPLTRNERSFASSDKHPHHHHHHVLHNTTIGDDDSGTSDNERVCTARSAPTSSGLLCNFEESALNGRLEPLAALDGFHLQIAASGSFSAPHVTLPVTTFFFDLSDDDAPSPYLGHCSLEQLGRKGYHIPKKGTFQAALFNPQGTVVRMFMVRFDVSEMPASSQTFLRQRTFFMPSGCPIERAQRSWLKYLIHLRLATDRRGRLYVHTDIRMLFSQKGDLEALNIELEKESQQKYELLSFTEMPQKPRFSPRK